MRLVAAVASLLMVFAQGAAVLAQQPPPADDVASRLRELAADQADLQHRFDELAKAVDDLAWFARLGDIAVVEKWRIYGPPDANPAKPKAPGAGNEIKFYTYTFVPRQAGGTESLPVLVLSHGGVHGDFDTYYVNIVREMVTQGYIVVAPDFRGSTGYGRGFYRLIDYGGQEVDDVHAAMEFALATIPRADPRRVGLIGWSHGGMISLLEAFAHPEQYACAFAGVPVSDLVARLGYSDDEYRELFSAPYHIGAEVRDDIAEYRRRSPVTHAHKLAIPLLVHTNTSDEDVNVLEVEHLIAALKAAGKTFEYKIFDKAPGGHGFDRMDTPEARKIRRDIYAFLSRHLKPPRTLP
ncbi:MAG: peptidase, family, catalytic domain protein [Deltaproteobacteria bacterium]|nr:peptidase, family, catalytic domain protein [Deltaproteobacteria bacterium]